MSGHTEPPQNTFVVRFWWEWRAEGSEPGRAWRGRIEHVQSGGGISFCDVDVMIAFIAQFIPLSVDKPSAP